MTTKFVPTSIAQWQPTKTTRMKLMPSTLLATHMGEGAALFGSDDFKVTNRPATVGQTVQNVPPTVGQAQPATVLQTEASPPARNVAETQSKEARLKTVMMMMGADLVLTLKKPKESKILSFTRLHWRVHRRCRS